MCAFLGSGWDRLGVRSVSPIRAIRVRVAFRTRGIVNLINVDLSGFRFSRALPRAGRPSWVWLGTYLVRPFWPKSSAKYATERRRNDTPGPGEGNGVDLKGLAPAPQSLDHTLHRDVPGRAGGKGAPPDPPGAGVEHRNSPRGCREDVLDRMAIGVIDMESE